MNYRTAEPEGDGYGFGALEGVVEQRSVYPDSSRCSDQVDVQNVSIRVTVHLKDFRKL